MMINQEEEADKCPICLEVLPKFAHQFNRFSCCGSGIHPHCSTDLMSTTMGLYCPLCRAETPTTIEESVEQLRPWVKKGKAWAQAQLACLYKDGGSKDGTRAFEKSYKKAKQLFELAEEQGCGFSKFCLGIFYYHGRGVEQSYERAKDYWEQAAHLGMDLAQFSLGRMYENGQGVEQSYAKAVVLYELASQQGHVGALFGLGIMYANGGGVEQSYERAKACFERGADLGDADSQHSLGVMYANGEGVEIDIAKTRELWMKAAAQGHKLAINFLRQIDRN